MLLRSQGRKVSKKVQVLVSLCCYQEEELDLEEEQHRFSFFVLLLIHSQNYSSHNSMF